MHAVVLLPVHPSVVINQSAALRNSAIDIVGM
jgi:hypothetical protein